MKSEILFQYDCGCIGMGRPHEPHLERNRKFFWADVIVIRPCPSDSDARGVQWVLPTIRNLVGTQMPQADKVVSR